MNHTGKPGSNSPLTNTKNVAPDEQPRKSKAGTMAAGHRSDLTENPGQLIHPLGNELTDPALRQRWTATPVKQPCLPVRSPGTHLHPLLLRPPMAGHAGGSSR